MPLLTDTTVLSNFAAAGRLDLLRALDEPVYMARAVYEEVQAGVTNNYVFLVGLETHLFPDQPEGWLRLVDVANAQEQALYEQALTTIQPGEAMSLAIAAQRGWEFATDDRGARRYGGRLGVPITGTLGLLVQFTRRGLPTIDEANSILAQMILRARYRSPLKDIRTPL